MLLFSLMFVYRLQLLISFKVSKMILYCCPLCVLALLVTFVMLEDWLLPCLVPDLVCICFVAILCLNNAMNCSLHFSFYFKDLIALPSVWMRAHHIYTERHVEDTGPIHLVNGVEEMISIFNWRYQVCMPFFFWF